MLGVIGNKQVATHLGLIWREFGLRCALRCVDAILRGRPTTFLDVAFDTSARCGGPSRVAAHREQW
jgi:hypothetical protein